MRSATLPWAGEGARAGAIMWPVIVALIPAVCVQTWFFGGRVLVLIGIAVLASLMLELTVLALRRRNWRNALSDGSVVITGTLIALAVPASLPSLELVLGVAFAVVVAKHCYGGLGHNLFNPAMVGYALIIVSFPASLTGWPLAETMDATTAATPLASMRSVDTAYALDAGGGQVEAWLWINGAYLVGGGVLLATRACGPDLPVAVIVGLLLTSGAVYATGASDWTPWMHLTSGASLCAAFFIATDPVTAPNLPRARLVYGLLIGALIVAIREFGEFPDGVAFAVLIANAGGPALDELERRLSERQAQ